MSTFGITFRCGDSGTINICGPQKDRQRKADWHAANHVCEDCYRAEREAALAAKKAQGAAKADATESAESLPALLGSEAQIAWARSIRAEALGGLLLADECMAQRIAAGTDPAARQQATAIWATVCENLRGQASAKWWIEHRREASFDSAGEAIYATAEESWAGWLVAGEGVRELRNK